MSNTLKMIYVPDTTHNFLQRVYKQYSSSLNGEFKFKKEIFTWFKKNKLTIFLLGS